RPRFRSEVHPLFGLDDALCRASTVGPLPEQAIVAVSIRSENNALAVSRPNWKNVRAPECEAAHGCRSRQVIDRDNLFAIVIWNGGKSDLLAVRRNPWIEVITRGKRDGFSSTFAIDEGEGPWWERCTTTARYVYERARVREAK